MPESQTRSRASTAIATRRGRLRGSAGSERERRIDRSEGRIPGLSKCPREWAGCRARGTGSPRVRDDVPHLLRRRPKRRVAIARNVAPGDPGSQFRHQQFGFGSAPLQRIRKPNIPVCGWLGLRSNHRELLLHSADCLRLNRVFDPGGVGFIRRLEALSARPYVWTTGIGLLLRLPATERAVHSVLSLFVAGY